MCWPWSLTTHGHKFYLVLVLGFISVFYSWCTGAGINHMMVSHEWLGGVGALVGAFEGLIIAAKCLFFQFQFRVFFALSILIRLVCWVLRRFRRASALSFAAILFD